MTLTLPLAALAGVASFASPCFLPVVPAWIGYVAGSDRSAGFRSRALGQTLVFMAGFTIVFVSVWVSLGLVGHALADHRSLLRITGGAILIVMGLHLAGIVNLSVLHREVRVAPRVSPTEGPRLGRSFLLGLAFAAGWTPCIGPILGGVIGLASTTGSVGDGTVLLLAYSLGLGVPFLIVAVGADSVARRFGWFQRHQRAVSVTSGLLLVLMGFLMVTDRFTQLAALIPGLGL